MGTLYAQTQGQGMTTYPPSSHLADDFHSPSAFLTSDVYAPSSDNTEYTAPSMEAYTFYPPHEPPPSFDDQTPVVTNNQPQIPPSTFPAPPDSLLSPFRPEPYMQQFQPMYSTQPVYPPFFLPSQEGSPTSVPSAGSSPKPTPVQVKPPRAKVKLTHEDKHNIVLLSRSNSSLRQEDIARQFGVDRSTISKIILAADRWQQPAQPHAPPPPKAGKSGNGRFPGVEVLLHNWMDVEIAAGRDVRDLVAREKAKEFGRCMGIGEDRFKASSKWIEKFKERRKAAGRPLSSPNGAFETYQPLPYADPSTMWAPPVISRSGSTTTFASSDSSQDMYQPSPTSLTYMPTPEIITPNRIGHLNTTPGRVRSQSSPQLPLGSPSSGKAESKHARPSPYSLQRQNSYHGTSPSPHRPTLLTRANTSQIPLSRRARPTSLAASAFGITPIIGDVSPLTSPTRSRQQSDVSLGPFTSSLGGMTISPAMSDGSEHMVMPLGVPPLTPAAPLGTATFSSNSNEYTETQYHVQAQAQAYPKQYEQPQYIYTQDMTYANQQSNLQ